MRLFSVWQEAVSTLPLRLANPAIVHRIISRNLRRNCAVYDCSYRPFAPSHRARARGSPSRCDTRFTPRQCLRVHRLLRRQWSPKQTAGFLHRDRTLQISHERIYTPIWRGEAAGGSLWRHTWGTARPRRTRGSDPAGSPVCHGRQSLAQRTPLAAGTGPTACPLFDKRWLG